MDDYVPLGFPAFFDFSGRVEGFYRCCKTDTALKGYGKKKMVFWGIDAPHIFSSAELLSEKRSYFEWESYKKGVGLRKNEKKCPIAQSLRFFGTLYGF